MSRLQPMTPMRRRRSPFLIPAVVLVALICGLVALSTVDGTKAQKVVEKTVTPGALAK